MTHKVGLYIILVALVAPLVQCISIVGPRVLRPYNSYTVALAGGSRAHTLYVAIEGRRANGEQYTEGREVQVPAGTSRLIELDISDPGPGQYALVARSTSGPLFSSSAPLHYQPRSFCIFVQTDKRVYQPGDTINFRVIALDKYLLPLSTTVDVSVLDTGGSPIRQWAGAELDRGVLTQELVLADEPALGEWTIQVEARGQKYSHHMLVADYVLPKFHMEMHLPKEVLFSEGRFDINVTAKHFNGLPVRGELTISAYPVFFSGLLQPVVAAPTRKVIDINGQTEVTFDLKTDLDLAEDAARPLVVEAVLEEKDTLIKQNISSRILLLRAPYRLRVSAPNYFKPTLPYIVQIELVDPSGKLLPTDGDITVERLWDDGAPVNVTKIALKKGLGTYTLVPDKGHVNSTLNLVINYKEVSERVVNIQRNEHTTQFLTAEILTRDTAVGGEMRARITATEPMDLVHYAVIGRGDIVVAKTLELSPARKSVDVTVSVTSRMAPGCIFLAWYPRLDAARNNLLSAAVYAPQKDLLQNQVIVSPVSNNGASPKPNTLVEIRILGEAGAVVGLLAEDNRAIDAGLAQANGLGSGLDINKIEREVETFNSLSHSVFKNEDHLSGSGLDLGGFTASDVFKNAGVVILTDGVVIRNNPDGSVQTQTPLETGTRAPLAGPYAFSRLPPPPSPRYYLTLTPQPTWMLANLTIGNDGHGAKERWTSESPGEFAIGAFSVHPTLGLGLATPQKFATSVPLTLTAELPSSMQRGETVAAVVILSTTLAVDTPVEVTFYNSDQYFEFEPLDNELDAGKKIELFRRVKVTVPARGSISTAFLVTVVRPGEASVIVEASGTGVTASLFRTIDVKDGYEEDLWAWSLLDARKTVARANVTLNVRPGVKPGAISLRATGDMLAAALQATKSPSAPSADATYALRPLALACVLLDYLQATGQEESATTKEARELAAFGYQRLMAYRRPDGSFVAENDPEADGDVWMTAVATRWLSRCSRYVSVEATPAASAAAWLAHAQQPDGSWTAPAPQAITDPHAQAALPLAAYALIALQQAKGSDVLYKNNINKALDYVARAVSPDLDAYTLAVASGALAVTRHPQLTQTLEIMNKYANTSGYTLFWSRTLYKNEWRNPWLVGNSLEATTAAWGLRSMLAARLLDEATPVVRYLLQAYQPNDPDPEVIDALAQYAEMTRTSTKLRVSVNVTGSEEPRQFQIAENNALFIQTQSVRNSRSVTAVTEGRGIALVGLSAKGSTNVTAPWPRYTLDPRVDQVSTKDRLQLSVCFGFVSQGNETVSGLALLTVQLPSGYLADITTLNELTSVRHVVWARVSAGGARVLAAVRAGAGERCATLAAPRALPVARQRPAWATLQDLYDSSKYHGCGQSVRHVVWARVSAGGARVLAAVRAGAGERCATLAAPRALPVARQRPAWATLQDLYDSSKYHGCGQSVRHVVWARVSAGGARVLAAVRAGAGERCATLAAPRALPVARQRPAWATLQDLYDSSKYHGCGQSVRHVVWARVSAGGARVLAAVRAGAGERCATLAAPRALPVARQRPAWATLQDLYDSSKYHGCGQSVRHVVWARVSAGGARVLAAVRAGAGERCATLAAPRALPVARQRPAWATLQDLYDSSKYHGCGQSVRHVVWARVSAGGARVLAAVRAGAGERCATLAAPRALPVARQRPAWATLQDLYDSSKYHGCGQSVRHVVWARVSAGGARVLAAVRAGAGERCATLAAPRALPVARQRPAWATLQDLYDSSHRARVFFQAQAATACDVCREWESCSRACGSAALQVSGDGQTSSRPEPDSAALATPTVLLALISTALALLH